MRVVRGDRAGSLVRLPKAPTGRIVYNHALRALVLNPPPFVRYQRTTGGIFRSHDLFAISRELNTRASSATFYSRPFRWLRRVKGGGGSQAADSGLVAVLRVDGRLKRGVSAVVASVYVCWASWIGQRFETKTFNPEITVRSPTGPTATSLYWRDPGEDGAFFMDTRASKLRS